jgi:hypothetical protein
MSIIIIIYLGTKNRNQRKHKYKLLIIYQHTKPQFTVHREYNYFHPICMYKVSTFPFFRI